MTAPRLVPAAIVILLLAACGEQAQPQSSPPPPPPADDQAPPDATTDDEPDADGDYLVVVVANVDRTTAESAHEALTEAGFGGFTLEGDEAGGYDVYQGGFDRAGAQAFAQEVAAEVSYQPMAWPAAKRP